MDTSNPFNKPPRALAAQNLQMAAREYVAKSGPHDPHNLHGRMMEAADAYMTHLSAREAARVNRYFDPESDREWTAEGACRLVDRLEREHRKATPSAPLGHVPAPKPTLHEMFESDFGEEEGRLEFEVPAIADLFESDPIPDSVPASPKLLPIGTVPTEPGYYWLFTILGGWRVIDVAGPRDTRGYEGYRWSERITPPSAPESEE